MARRVAAVVGIVVALLALAVIPLASAFVGLAPLRQGQDVVPGVTTVVDGYVASFLVDAGLGRFVLVDCGNDPTARPILDALRGRGLTPDAVIGIVLTHGHPDHVAGCSHFPRARVYALGAERDLVEGRVGAKGPLPRLVGPNEHALTVDEDLTDGQAILLGQAELVVFAVPGHTAGSAAFLARGVLFLGDNATVGADGALRPAPWVFSDDTAENVASLVELAARTADLPVRRLAPSHSGPGDAQALSAWAALQNSGS